MSAENVGAGRLLLDRLVGIATEFDGVDTARAGYVMVESIQHGTRRRAIEC
jgi:hypothetical protein